MVLERVWRASEAPDGASEDPKRDLEQGGAFNGDGERCMQSNGVW